jgi:serine/threonine protein kinase
MPSASTVIGRYQVVDRLGQGGMGTVYLARDPGLDRLVAIKVLRGDFEDEELRERFAREARSISRLRHPNIVTIFEYGDHNGHPFIVMEYISGESMAEMIARRVEMTVARKLQMIEELCAGMAYAHRAKIVHRDIKPANIMLDEESGLVKILDFGIARDLDSSLTRFTQVVGTPSYMSPEQANGQPLDHRSDIFSIGSVFYELLGHRQAFEGKNQLDVMDRITRGEPTPLSTLCHGLSPAIHSIIDRALQKDAANRYQDLEAMRADIFRARESGTSNSEATVVMPSPKAIQATTPQPPNQLEKRRASQIKAHLDVAEAALQSGDSDAAVESCEQVLLLDATNARALQLLDSAHVAQQRSAIEGHIQRARGYFDQGALTDAEDALAEALKLRSQDTAARGSC